MNYYGITTERGIAEVLKDYLQALGLYYEPSQCYERTHLEIRCTERQAARINAWLDRLYSLGATTDTL